MQRRDFLAASAVATTAAASAPLLAHAQAAGGARQYCEWRTYRLKGAEKHAIVEKFLQAAAVPAWSRMGLGPVGVFKEIAGEGATDPSSSIHVLLIYPTIDKFGAERTTLEHDPEYQKNAVEYFAATKADPAFERIDSWLMISFEGMPKPQAPDHKPRVVELRTYESHSEERARKKIEMFNAGEIEIFRKCGFENVFFGETLVGANLPHLKYMLAAPDLPANAEGWTKFRNHPDWLAMKDKPEYKDAVSKVSRMYLEPTAYSQI